MFNRNLIKKFLVGGFIACSMITNASAKEAAKKPKVQPETRMPFDGLYIGGSISAGFFEAFRGDNDGYLTDNSTWIATDFRPGAGLQIGHDWQKGGRVLGIVGDMNWLGSDVTIRDNPNGGDVTPNEIQNTLTWAFTLRGRVGMVNDDTLLYLTGGLALSDIGTSIRDAETHDFSRTRFGVTGGAGAEFVLGGRWSLGGEFLYTKFAPETITFTETAADFAFDTADSTTQLKIVLNYRF